jgi:hypothetical protein
VTIGTEKTVGFQLTMLASFPKQAGHPEKSSNSLSGRVSYDEENQRI